MTVADDLAKWNRRYAERAAEPVPHPLALRLRPLMRGGRMLDAACGLGRGVAAAGDLFDECWGVDLSEAALQQARAHWGERPGLHWVVGDVVCLPWPADAFDLICAFGFTDWAFIRRVPALLRPGGLFLHEGFARRQRVLRPGLNPDWTSTPQQMRMSFPDWRLLVCTQSDAPPFRTTFAAQRPAAPAGEGG